MSCLIGTKTPGGEANYMLTRLYPGLELPQFWELTSKKWKQVHPRIEDLTIPKTTKMMLVGPLMTNWTWLLEMTVLFLHVTHCPPNHSIHKNSHCLLIGRELGGIDAFELWCWRRLLRVPWTARRSNQSILKDFFGRNDAKAETPILWPPHVKSWFIGKDPDAGRD